MYIYLYLYVYIYIYPFAFIDAFIDLYIWLTEEPSNHMCLRVGRSLAVPKIRALVPWALGWLLVAEVSGGFPGSLGGSRK